MASPSPTQVKILVPGNHLMVGLLGQRDELLRLVEGSFPVEIHVRGNEITVTGDASEAERVGRLFEEMVILLEQGHSLDREGVGRSIEMLKADQRPTDVFTTEVLRGRKSVRPKTSGQKEYVDAVREHTVTFCIGPAGTGKSYLAVALAVQALQAKQINRIILTRPAVEAGERLGFLPGDILAKVDPYLRPLYDALFDMLDPEVVTRLMDRGSIDVPPGTRSPPSGRCSTLGSSASYSSVMSPTISSSRSSRVTSPEVPPYSSITIAMWNCFVCISRSSSATRFCSGTNTASRSAVRIGSFLLLARASATRSFRKTRPMMLSVDSS